MNRVSNTLRIALFAAALAAAFVLAPGITQLRAEDSGVFMNPGDISRAQDILVDEGYLAAGEYSVGQLDRATRDALSQYQQQHALNDSGTLDDDTYQTMLSHEASYPWDDEQTARTEVASDEPVAPVAEAAPASEVQVAQAAPVPEPTPAPEEVKEAPEPAPAATPAAAEQEPARTMPATASHLPTLALTGLALLGLGILVLVRRSA